jgi:hypothetical protein
VEEWGEANGKRLRSHHSILPTFHSSWGTDQNRRPIDPTAGISSFTAATSPNYGEFIDSFTPFAGQYINFDIHSNHGAPGYVGLAEVKFFGAPYVPPGTVVTIR